MTKQAEPKADSWVGRYVVLKHRPKYLTQPEFEGKDVASGLLDCWQLKVVSETEEWVHVEFGFAGARLHKSDVVLGQDAVEYFTRLIRREPTQPDHYLRRAISVPRTNGLKELAMADCDRAIKLDPTDARAWVVRGMIRYWLQELTLGLDDLTEAIRLAPDAAWTWVARGQYWQHSKEYQKADSDFTAAINLEPHSSLVFRDRGRARTSAGNSTGAVEDLTRAVELEPASASARFFRGSLFYGLGQSSKAIEDLTEAIRLDPLDPELWSYRAAVHGNYSQWAKARADYAEAIRLNPDDVASILARAALPAVKYPNNEAEFQTAVRLCDETGWKEPAALVKLAIAQAEYGNHLEAVKWLGMALSFPEFAAKHDGDTKALLRAYQEPCIEKMRRWS